MQGFMQAVVREVPVTPQTKIPTFYKARTVLQKGLVLVHSLDNINSMKGGSSLLS